MRAARDANGDVVLDALTPLDADTLLRLPEWLATEDDEVRKRLFPEVYTDPDEEAQWRKFGACELEHLFASKLELVKKDLATMQHVAPIRYRMAIANVNLKAWLQSLNAARLAIFTQHGLGPADMEMDPGDAGSEAKELALLRIHVMAYVQELLLRV